MIEDRISFYGEIPELQGVWANTKSLEACRDEPEAVLGGWIILSLQQGHTIPVIDRIDWREPL